MATAIKVEGLGKRFLLGQTFENTLSSRVGDLFRGRGLGRRAAPPEEFWALRDVSFDIAQGEAVGIIGGNGAGKSTLLKILSRITPPTLGRASVRGRLSSLLEVGTGFHPELTGRENVFLNGAILGMRKAEVERKFDEIVAFSGVEKFIDTPVKRYSSGMYVRLAFAVAAHLEPDVLIIDEVLAVGDADFQKRCLGKMNDVAREGRTVIFVSHNMAAVQAITSRCVWLQHGNLLACGPTTDVVESYLDRGAGNDTYDLTGQVREHSGLSGELRLTKTTLVEIGVGDYGTRLIFDVVMTVAAPCPRGRLGISITRADGVPAGALFTEYFETTGVDSELTLRVTTPEMRLGNARYTVSISVGVCDSAAGSAAFDAVTNVLSFNVMRPTSASGTVMGWNAGWGVCDFGLARVCRAP